MVFMLPTMVKKGKPGHAAVGEKKRLLQPESTHTLSQHKDLLKDRPISRLCRYLVGLRPNVLGSLGAESLGL